MDVCGMGLMPIAKLDRTILRLSGEAVSAWLDGLITNSIAQDITFAALLTPQGKIIADFFVTRDADDLLLDTPSKFGDALLKRLKMYKLRAPITMTDESDKFHLYAVWDGEGSEGFEDPRLPALGRRIISRDLLETTGDYNAHRLSLGIVDSLYDFDTQTTFPADANMDLMNGVDFQKGCFVGQEVVSRMKRMTIVKKRLRGLVFSSGSHVKAQDDIKCGARTVGQVYHVHGDMGMGLVRLDRLKSATQNPTVNGIAVQIMKAPDGSNR